MLLKFCGAPQWEIPENGKEKALWARIKLLPKDSAERGRLCSMTKYGHALRMAIRQKHISMTEPARERVEYLLSLEGAIDLFRAGRFQELNEMLDADPNCPGKKEETLPQQYDQDLFERYMRDFSLAPEYGG